jgi:uncharacterized protein YcbX
VVHDLFRYPIKSMQSERLHDVDTDVQGIVGNRACALRDLNARFATSKKWPTMADLTAPSKWVQRSSLCKCGPRYPTS